MTQEEDNNHGTPQESSNVLRYVGINCFNSMNPNGRSSSHPVEVTPQRIRGGNANLTWYEQSVSHEVKFALQIIK